MKAQHTIGDQAEEEPSECGRQIGGIGDSNRKMTLPKGYKLPQAEKERLEKIEREHARLRNNARGFDPEYQE